jgi:hypothetical protein
MSSRTEQRTPSRGLVTSNVQPELPAESFKGQGTCPICGAMTKDAPIGASIGDRARWTCLVGGYAHYYQSRYGHLKQWFTSGEGNLREPLIQAMNCAL